VQRGRAPLAFGERLTSIWEFRELLQAAGALHLRPDVGTAGGLTHCKKIAALAESYNAPITSHNWLGPLLSSASIHLDVSIPNFVVQEYDPADEDRSDYGMFRSSLQREGGYMLAPTAPGLGVDVAWDELETDPPAGFDLKGQAARMIRPDGSMGGPA
jgi:galactonate dehydratase